MLKKNFIRSIVNTSVTLLTFDDKLKKEIPLTLSSMDKVKEVKNTLIPKVSPNREKIYYYWWSWLYRRSFNKTTFE